MVEILRIMGATRVIGKSQGYYGLPLRDEPSGLSDEPLALETFTEDPVTGPNTPAMITAWQFNPEELLKLTKGAPLYLKIIGQGHPPLMLIVGEIPE